MDYVGIAISRSGDHSQIEMIGIAKVGSIDWSDRFTGDALVVHGDHTHLLKDSAVAKFVSTVRIPDEAVWVYDVPPAVPKLDASVRTIVTAFELEIDSAAKQTIEGVFRSATDEATIVSIDDVRLRIGDHAKLRSQVHVTGHIKAQASHCGLCGRGWTAGCPGCG
jgi:hypothetical protein